MQEETKNIEEIKKYIEQHQIKNIKLTIVDIDGVLRGKYVNINKFTSALEKGFGFCNVIFGWDSNDELYKKDSFTGWKDGFADSTATIDASSLRMLPTEDSRSVIFLADFSESLAASVCP